MDAAQAKFHYREKSAGKEKMKMQWKKVADATTQAGFGDPANGDTSVAVCIYDDLGGLVQDFLVDQAGQLCAGTPCWKARGTKSYGYKDRNNASDGIAKIVYRAGEPGRGAADVRGKNDIAHGQAALPTGVVAALRGNVSPTECVAVCARDGQQQYIRSDQP
ncbi:MAG: hypothetical protein ACI8TX_000440 [Hyphomicrobiaceae bacterium]